MIRRTYAFKDFRLAMTFVNKVADAANARTTTRTSTSGTRR